MIQISDIRSRVGKLGFKKIPPSVIAKLRGNVESALRATAVRVIEREVTADAVAEMLAAHISNMRAASQGEFEGNKVHFDQSDLLTMDILGETKAVTGTITEGGHSR